MDGPEVGQLNVWREALAFAAIYGIIKVGRNATAFLGNAADRR